jgi:nickel-dependent lactate racemase
MRIEIPYHREKMTVELPEQRVKAVLRSAHPAACGLPEHEIVARALAHPIASPPLFELARGKRRVLVITSDHTRPVPSRITMPLLLEGIRKGSPDADIRILIATGFHRTTTAEELQNKFGEDICRNETIVVHDAFDPSQMAFKGTLPSGGALWINALVDWADFTVAEGFIEPHFFAGFSGGRKAVLPGICSEKTIMYNHNSVFIADPRARTGLLAGNPLHRDMLFASKAAKLSFILNVTIDEDKKVTAAFAGDPEAAHMMGCEAVRSAASVKAVKADIAVSSNGGYPLDQNIYQTVKGMTAAEACLNAGGVLIMVSACSNGHGGEGFYNWFKQAASPKEVAEKIAAIPPEDTLPDQWEAQILARVLKKCRAAILVSRHADPQLVRDMGMLPAKSFEEALAMADEMLGGQKQMVVIPDGVGVIVEEA